MECSIITDLYEDLQQAGNATGCVCPGRSFHDPLSYTEACKATGPEPSIGPGIDGLDSTLDLELPSLEQLTRAAELADGCLPWVEHSSDVGDTQSEPPCTGAYGSLDGSSIDTEHQLQGRSPSMLASMAVDGGSGFSARHTISALSGASLASLAGPPRIRPTQLQQQQGMHNPASTGSGHASYGHGVPHLTRGHLFTAAAGSRLGCPWAATVPATPHAVSNTYWPSTASAAAMASRHHYPAAAAGGGMQASASGVAVVDLVQAAGTVLDSSYSTDMLSGLVPLGLTVPPAYALGLGQQPGSLGVRLQQPVISSSGTSILMASGLTPHHNVAAAAGAAVAPAQQQQCQLPAAVLAQQLVTAGSLDSSSTGVLGALGSLAAGTDQTAAVCCQDASTSLCASCLVLEAQADILAQRCASASKVTPAAKAEVCKLLHMIAACPQQCLVSHQLPAEGTINRRWVVTYPKARQAKQGGQRAGAGTALGRNYNFNANAPCPVCCSDAAWTSGWSAFAAAIGKMYTINSSDKRSPLTAIAIVRHSTGNGAAVGVVNPDTSATTVGGCPAGDGSVTGSGSSNSSSNTHDGGVEALWSSRAITCAKTGSAYKDHVFDLFKYAFFFHKHDPKALNITGVKRKAVVLL